MTTQDIQQAIRKFVPAELLFPDVEGPYKTVWQFLYEREPWVLDDLEDEDGGALRKLVADDAKARRIALREKEPVITLEAPEALKRIGHPRVGCYTKAVLFETFPVGGG